MTKITAPEPHQDSNCPHCIPNPLTVGMHDFCSCVPTGDALVDNFDYSVIKPIDMFVFLDSAVPTNVPLYSFTFTVSTKNNRFCWNQKLLREIVGETPFWTVFFEGYSFNRLGLPNNDRYVWNRLTTHAQYRFLNQFLHKELSMISGLKFIGFIETSAGSNHVHAHVCAWIPNTDVYLNEVQKSLFDIVKKVNPYAHALKDVANRVTDREAWLEYICKDYYGCSPLFHMKKFTNI